MDSFICLLNAIFMLSILLLQSYSHDDDDKTKVCLFSETYSPQNVKFISLPINMPQHSAVASSSYHH